MENELGSVRDTEGIMRGGAETIARLSEKHWEQCIWWKLSVTVGGSGKMEGTVLGRITGLVNSFFASEVRDWYIGSKN